MPEPDYYELLGVTRTATAEEIKNAYRDRARALHPDRNPEDPEAGHRFAAVEYAHRILSDEKERRGYDRRTRPATSNDMRRLKDLFARDHAVVDAEEDAEDAYDISQTLTLDSQTARTGGRVKTVVPVRRSCGTCSGSGTQPGSIPSQCPKCHGRGTDPDSPKLFKDPVDCGRCGGAGTVTEPCPTCEGRRQVKAIEPVLVTVPGGISTGQCLRIRQSGLQRRDGTRGDLYLQIVIGDTESAR